MNKATILDAKKILFFLVISCFFVQMKAQNDQISIQSVNSKEFTVKSINGIPFTVILENSNNDGQYHMGVNNLRFKLEDMIGKRSTIRIKFEKEIYLSLENKLIEDYQADVQWIESKLEIKEGEFEIFPSRPVVTDEGLEKLKGTVFEYVTNDQKEKQFNKWIDKVNYSVGAFRFFQELYAASNGEDTGQSYNFLPINIYEELHKN